MVFQSNGSFRFSFDKWALSFATWSRAQGNPQFWKPAETLFNSKWRTWAVILLQKTGKDFFTTKLNRYRIPKIQRNFTLLCMIFYSRWIIVYPAYLNSRRTVQQGRRVPKDKVEKYIILLLHISLHLINGWPVLENTRHDRLFLKRADKK